jgi:hypothetical protein
MSRKSNHNGPEQLLPLVNPVRIKYEALKGCELDTRLLEKMAQYSAYVEKHTGNKPTPGEIVSAGLEEVFTLDKGFIKWQEEKQPVSEQLEKLAAAAPHVQPVKAKTNGVPSSQPS